MSTLDEIVAAAQMLDAGQFLKLRRRLDRLEAKLWDAELDRTTRTLKHLGMEEEDLDRLVERRRRESRP